jgi:hypothetical protein
MDWEAEAHALLDIVLRRSFPAGYDYESNWPALVQEFRDAVSADLVEEMNALKARLATLDAAFAAEERLKKLPGAKQADIDALKNSKG